MFDKELQVRDGPCGERTHTAHQPIVRGCLAGYRPGAVEWPSCFPADQNQIRSGSRRAFITGRACDVHSVTRRFRGVRCQIDAQIARAGLGVGRACGVRVTGVFAFAGHGCAFVDHEYVFMIECRRQRD